ncbi:MAG: iron donor protein CyaY [Nannocystaceae bacterium]
MERSDFTALSTRALEHIEQTLGGLEHDALDVQLAGDVLTLAFADGGRFVINAHSAAGQIWMAAGRTAWHFDWVPARGQWVAAKNGDELMSTLARVVGDRLGAPVSL